MRNSDIKRFIGLIATGLSLSAFALTEIVNGITWTYTDSNGEASVYDSGHFNAEERNRRASGGVKTYGMLVTLPSIIDGLSILCATGVSALL